MWNPSVPDTGGNEMAKEWFQCDKLRARNLRCENGLECHRGVDDWRKFEEFAIVFRS